MQTPTRSTRWIRKASIGLGAVVMSHTASCDTNSINTIIDTVQAVVGQLDDSTHRDDISFGDWILDELRG